MMLKLLRFLILFLGFIVICIGIAFIILGMLSGGWLVAFVIGAFTFIREFVFHE